MSIVTETTLKCNSKLKINFDGGNLSSDSGLLLVKEFIHKLGIDSLVKQSFRTNDRRVFKIHTDDNLLLQAVYQYMASYFTDDCADALRTDPVFCATLGKGSLASQPTMSRFFNRLDETTIEQLNSIFKAMRKRVYEIERPEHVLLDIDTTLCNTYGNQEGANFNYHYQANGYHPLVCFDAMTSDLIAAELRPGSEYCCKDIRGFMEPIFEEYRTEYPEIALFVRGDSGFATDELYSVCEEYDVKYAIRLKESNPLRQKAAPVVQALIDRMNQAEDSVSYCVAYGEFQYQANSWDHKRRVVCKVEKPQGQIVPIYTFVVTNMKFYNPEILIQYYCKRGAMENMIKECKSGFDMAGVSSSGMAVNANRMLIHAFAYNIFNWMRRLTFPENMKQDRIDTIRLKLFKIASRIVSTGRYLYFKLCSACAYKVEFMKVLTNIYALNVQLE